jgi:hypothetical protein
VKYLLQVGIQLLSGALSISKCGLHSFVFGFIVNYTGIVGYMGGLIVSNFRLGGLFFVNVTSGETVEMLDRELLPMPSGLVIDDQSLYVTQCYPDSVSVWRLKEPREGEFAPRAKHRETIISDQFDDPRSSAIVNGYLYTVNSRMKSTGLPAEGENLQWFQEEFNMAEISLS